MYYALLIYYDQDAAVSPGESSRRQARFAAIRDWLQASGVLAGSQQLQPGRAAHTVRCWDGGDIMIADGPAAPTREQLSGWLIADCADLDQAIELATTIPAAWYGSIEVRPLRVQPDSSDSTACDSGAIRAAADSRASDSVLMNAGSTTSR